MSVSQPYRPSIRHATLGDDFFDVVEPARFPAHILRFRNERWAERVGLADLSDAEWMAHFSGFAPLPGSFERPLALRYHGHQFRHYNPEIGDGRGFLFAQLHDDEGRLLDLATKGSGRTPWSRTADGRLTLKGGMREVLATEMLEALGVDTSKTFSLIETGEALQRGDEPSPTRSAVLVRLSHSHVRVGSFQRLLYLEQHENIAKLLDHSIETYAPEARRNTLAERAVAFVETTCRKVARTGARWMMAGFVHGVLNTDNINITGESFDYGPWRFAPVADPAFTAAYFDHNGLYAYGRQPDALLWNLTRLAECFLPFAAQADLEKALGTFQPAFHQEFQAAMLWRLGLEPASADAEAELVRSLWKFMLESRAPFERTLFDWRGGSLSGERAATSPSADLYASSAFEPVRKALSDLEPSPGALDHTYFKKRDPCTMLIDQVEALWEPIAREDDWSAFHAKIAAVREMGDAYRIAPA